MSDQNMPPVRRGEEPQEAGKQLEDAHERGDNESGTRFDPLRGGGGGHRQGGGRRRSHNAQQSTGGAGQPSRRSDEVVGAAVNMDELRELVELIATHGFTDFELEREGFRVRLRRELSASQSSASQNIPAPKSTQSQTAPMPPTIASSDSTIQATENAAAAVATNNNIGGASQQATPSTPTPSAPKELSVAGEALADDVSLHKITSPIVGTFYRAPSPTAEPFARVGSAVEPDTVVCIIEAMKLMNEILAETTGTIEKVYVENGQPVEFGQPLFGVRQ